MAFAQEQLTFYNEALEGVIDNLPTGVNVVRGSDLTYQIVNPAYQKIAYGKEILGKSIKDVWPEIYPQLKELYTYILETGNSYHAHDEKFVIRRTPDGPFEEAYFDHSLMRIKLPGNEGWGVLNTATETTERGKAEETLMKERELLQAIIDNIPVMISIYDPQIDVLQINNEFKELLVGLKKIWNILTL
ncbi:PAS domain-containing protein [Methanobacterium sp. ACI-7]|uniref:PAS domain-containing protein n=1 Tax=unclassified Methanobacterium TaxID=2627676 RepID=UPI0039C02408